MTEETNDPILFQRLLEELIINVDGPIRMYSDNKSAIEWATGYRLPGKRAKHVDVSVHYIRELVENKGLMFHMLPQMTTSQMDSEKPLWNLKFHQVVKDLGMVMVQTTVRGTLIPTQDH
jgi:hypothetical protein